MPATRWVHVLSLELGWMTPAQARRYVDGALHAGILVADDAGLALVADPSGVEISRGFRPDPDALPEAKPQSAPGADPFSSWLHDVATAQGKDVGSVMDAISGLQERFGGHLGAFPALLLLAREAGLAVQDAARTELDSLTTTAP